MIYSAAFALMKWQYQLKEFLDPNLNWLIKLIVMFSLNSKVLCNQALTVTTAVFQFMTFEQQRTNKYGIQVFVECNNKYPTVIDACDNLTHE